MLIPTFSTILTVILMICMIVLAVTMLPWDSTVAHRFEGAQKTAEVATVGTMGLLVVTLILLFV